MTTPELRAYVLQHRDDDEAFYALSDRIRENGKPLKLEDLPELIRRKEQGLS